MADPRHEQRAHSRLGASSSYRWMNCPGSVRATEGLDSESIWAAEGTAAHELAEKTLNHEEVARYAHDSIGQEIAVGNHVFEVDEEMADAVQVYVDLIRDTDHQDGDVVMIERRFSLEDVRAGMFGTNDALRYRPSTKRLTVYDYKHGVKPVDPYENPQLLYYALGAALNHGWPVDEVELVIVQPRAFGQAVKRWVTNLLHVVGFASLLKAAADATQEPNAPLIAGPWCKESFCPRAGTCEAYRTLAKAAARMEFADAPASSLTGEELASILTEADAIRDWVAAVWGEAARRAEAGDPPPGFKLVAKIARRKWVGEPEKVAPLLARHFGLTDDELYADPKLKSPAQIEKLLPKDKRGDLAELVEKVSSGNTLARETDRRAPVQRATAADDFGSEN